MPMPPNSNGEDAEAQGSGVLRAVASAVHGPLSRLAQSVRTSPRRVARKLTFDQVTAEVLLQLRTVPEDRAAQHPVETLSKIAAPLMSSLPSAPPLELSEVSAIIHKLPPVTQAVLRLHLTRELHYRQIGESLGIPADEALSHLRDALAHLREHLPQPHFMA